MAKHDIYMIRFGSTDLERTKAFYKGVFKWEMNELSDEILGFTTPNGFGGVFVLESSLDPGNSVHVSVEVPEFESYSKKIKEFGGDVPGEPTDFLNYGSGLRIADPDGNILGLWRRE